MRTSGLRPAAGVRVDDDGRELVLVDAGRSVVHRLVGAAADLVRTVVAGRDADADPLLVAALTSAGILAEADRGARSAPRRSVLAAAGLGITSLALPTAASATSLAMLGGGGSGYLHYHGAAEASSAPTGDLQYVRFTDSGASNLYILPDGVATGLWVEVLMVGGGGGGAVGGGGGGQVVRGLHQLEASQDYAVVVAAGGVAGDHGGDTAFARSISNPVAVATALGGSAGSSATGGDGGGSPGFAGGTGAGGGAGSAGAGGGAGASSPGGAASGNAGGAGGAGRAISGFVGADATYGGGGGGGGYFVAERAAGGAGGGGGGGLYDGGFVTTPSSGVDGLGGGGGGAHSVSTTGGAGGSGLIVFRYFGARPQLGPSLGAG